ncbi:MAG: hypothetical protein ACE5FL_11345, partial [Myxococcota bacterium]
TPFALVLAARGLFAVVRPPALRAAGVAVLAVAAAVSVAQYTAARVQHPPYQALARALVPRLASGDVVLVNDAWWTQPIHYYLPPDRFRTGDFTAHLRGLDGAPAERPARVWVVILADADQAASEVLAPRLAAYREVDRVTAPGAHARLFALSAPSP